VKETRTPENKRITTSNVSTHHPLPYKQRHTLLVYPPYILSHLLKCFFLSCGNTKCTKPRAHTHTHTQWKPEVKNPHREQWPEENPEDVEHTNPQTTHSQPILKTIDNTTYYHGPQTTPNTSQKNSHPTNHWSLDIPLNKLTVTHNDDEISASPRNIGIYMILFEHNCNNLKMAAIGQNM